VRTIALLAAMLAITISLHAERLPIKSFSSDEGLAHDHINQIYRDSHGFLSICTDEAFRVSMATSSRTSASPMVCPHANAILEVPDKGSWIATDDGLVWFDTKFLPSQR
jgi:hypothetical protein